MKIIRPYAYLMEMSEGENPLKKIEWCGRISHRSEDDQKETSYTGFIRRVVLEHGDWSIAEHVSATVDAVVDRGVTHEWVRHRLYSYTQESTRFVNYVKKMPPSFIYPQVGVECPHCLAGGDREFTGDSYCHIVGPEHDLDEVPCPYDVDWIGGIATAEQKYQALLAKGWRPQEARSVFPNALASRLISTANLRSWRHFFIMRTTKEAHPQMRQVTIPLLAAFKAAFPILFDDIQPEARQIDNLRLPG